MLFLINIIIVKSHNAFTSCFPHFPVWLQKLLNENTTLVQTEVKTEEPAMASGKLNIPPLKKVHGKELKGPPFISKPEDILFKVPHQWFC